MKTQYEIINNKRIQYIKTFIVDMKHRTSHIHSDFEFCLILDGKVKVMSNKYSCIACQNDILLFNPGVPHEFDATDDKVRILSVQISKRFCLEYFPSINNIIFKKILISDAMLTKEKNLIKHCLVKICFQYYKSDFANELICMNLVNIIFRTLLKSLKYTIITESEKESIYSKSLRIMRITDYIENNYSRKLLLSDVAHNEGITLSYLSHLFKENLNITFRDYLNNIRFEKAKLLALNTNMNSLEICIECGFSDAKYLQKMFMQYYQCKMKQFRLKYQKFSIEKDEKKLALQDLQSFLSEEDIFDSLDVENSIAEEAFREYSLFDVL